VLPLGLDPHKQFAQVSPGRTSLTQDGKEENGLADCLALLTSTHIVAGTGQWKCLDRFERNYMIAFDRLKADMEADMEAAGSIPMEDIPAMQKLERKQRYLARLIRRRQQVIRDQLEILNNAQNRLHRVKHLSQMIAGM